jgi:hypothetical protein
MEAPDLLFSNLKIAHFMKSSLKRFKVNPHSYCLLPRMERKQKQHFTHSIICLLQRTTSQVECKKAAAT